MFVLRRVLFLDLELALSVSIKGSPTVNCRRYFINSDPLVGGVQLDPKLSKMVSLPSSMELEVGLTFTVGAFTWTNGAAMAARTAEVVQSVPAPASSTTPTTKSISGPLPGSPAPTTGRPLPCYQWRQVDNSNQIRVVNVIWNNPANRR